MPHRTRHLVVGLLLVALVSAGRSLRSADQKATPSVFAKDNLVAWCIVPFDASNRGPDERAEMLKRLGITKVAYDWRAKHVPTFEAEILAYRRHGLDYFAFWGWHPDMEPLIKKHGIRPQIWKTNPSPKTETQEEKVEAAARQLLPLAERARSLGCKLGLYNHGGWGGGPENLAAVCRRLKDGVGAEHVGIVYNFHHGHDHIHDFAHALDLMQPHLLCLNLNGMSEGTKILPLGQGRHERTMMRIVRESGYDGPIGILDHRAEIDAEQSLRQNLEGLQDVLRQLGDRKALESY